MDKTAKQELTLRFVSPMPVDIGDYVYGVYGIEQKNFFSPCPTCDDTKKVVIRGRTFNCPHCYGGSYSKAGATNITIQNYVVLKYKVYGITYTESSDSYESKTNRPPTLLFKCFAKYKRGLQYSGWDNKNADIYPAQIVFEKVGDFASLDELSKEFHMGGNINRGFFRDCKADNLKDKYFHDYDTALALAEYLNAEEQEKLNKFNVEHGSSHKTEFEMKSSAPVKKKKR